jgi:hypothetical protein
MPSTMSVRRHLQLEHDLLARPVGVLDRVVAQRIAGAVDVDRPLGPVVAHDPKLGQLLAPLLEILDAGQVEPPVQQVLAEHPGLQAAGAQVLIERPDIEQDDVGVDPAAEPGGVVQAAVGLLRAVDAAQDAKPLVSRRFHADRALLRSEQQRPVQPGHQQDYDGRYDHHFPAGFEEVRRAVR